MKIEKQYGVPPVTPVVPVDNERRPQQPPTGKGIAFKGPVDMHVGARKTPDELSFVARKTVQPLIGIYTKDGRII